MSLASVQPDCKVSQPVVCSGKISYFCRKENKSMHQNVFHKICLHLALLTVIIFSIAGYHHHEDAHVCLGWEHLMHHNHCHKGLPCLPNDANSSESSCSCHSGRILAVETHQEQSVRKQDLQSSRAFCFFSSCRFPSVFLNRLKQYPNNSGPRSPASPQLRAHGRRGPPCFIF